MDDLIIPILFLMLMAFVGIAIILPIVSLVISVRSRRMVRDRAGLSPHPSNREIRQLTERVNRLEALLADRTTSQTTAVADEEPQPAPVSEPVQVVVLEPPIGPATSPAVPGPSIRTFQADQIESIIGRRWVGWAAIALILFATAFFLKYAFDNRWIGELGRVAIGITFGVVLSVLGYRYHRRSWRIFAQILTAGGIVLLYVSVYAAFGYYHLINQKVAFGYLAILIAEAAGLALVYNAPAIAIMALSGGFLTPLLLHSDRDQYLSLFGYIIALDIGALALLKHWRGLSSLAFFGTHVLFWLWYEENYHSQKLHAVLTFQLAVFLIFLLANLTRQMLLRQNNDFEDLTIVVLNPFVFFSTIYYLLNPQHHEWMGVMAIAMALVYAISAKILLDRADSQRSHLLILIAIALTFLTIAIPIQLKSNWITITWAVEALALLWVGLESRSQRLRIIASMLFVLALAKLFIWDTPFYTRPAFTPIFNRYFLSSFAIVFCLFSGAALYQRLNKQTLNKQTRGLAAQYLFLLTAIVTLWLITSVDTYTYFAARAALQHTAEEVNHQEWLGQMALSVVWATYAALLAAIGFSRRSAWIRWAALALFALTVVKAMLVDIAVLAQLYRIIVFFVLGILLLLVAWGYHRAFHTREASQ